MTYILHRRVPKIVTIECVNHTSSLKKNPVVRMLRRHGIHPYREEITRRCFWFLQLVDFPRPRRPSARLPAKRPGIRDPSGWRRSRS